MEDRILTAGEQNLSGTQESFTARIINGDNAAFIATDGGFVALDFGGRHYDRVDFYRAFPFTAPDRYISVREPDGKHAEIGMIDSLESVGDAAELIGAQIALRYFTPKITRVLSTRDRNGTAVIECDTDRGHCSFTIRGGSDAVTHLSDTRLIFTDVDGNRFEIPDVNDLSKKEQKRIDLYI